MRGLAMQGIGAFMLVSAVVACTDEQPTLTKVEALTAWTDAELAAYDAEDRASIAASDGTTVSASADVRTPCVLDGEARVVGGFDTTDERSSFTIAFDRCMDEFATVDGQLRASARRNTNGLWVSSLLGSVVVHDRWLDGKYPEGASCDLDVHVVVEDVPEGSLVTFRGDVCGWDAETLIPPGVVQ